MTFCVIQGSLYFAFSSAMISSWPFEPQLATTVMMPWTTSGLTLCSMSGSAIVMLNDTVGILPCPRPNSLIFSSPSLASETAFGMNSRRSGRADLTFWIRGVASESGGVQTSSTTSSRPSCAKIFSFSAFAVATEVAVLSISMATVFGRLPDAASASFINSGTPSCDCTLAGAAVWKMNLNPRSVSRSE